MECGMCGGERSFLTAEEKRKRLKEYKECLENEAKGVEEAITRIAPRKSK